MLNTAIKPALLFVLEAMAETRVSTEASAELPKMTQRMKEMFAVIGLPKKRL